MMIGIRSLDTKISIHAPHAGSDGGNMSKDPHFRQKSRMFLQNAACASSFISITQFIFVAKRRFFARTSREIMFASASRQIMSVPSGKYAFLQPKCSIFFSY